MVKSFLVFIVLIDNNYFQVENKTLDFIIGAILS